MLAKKFRLTEQKDFKKIQEDGEVYQSSSFGVAYLKKSEEETSRFGFIVSTKISKDAVDRNRFKRTMSEAVRMCSVDIKNGFDVVFLAKTSIIRVPTSEVMKEVKESLNRIHVLK